MRNIRKTVLVIMILLVAVTPILRGQSLQPDISGSWLGRLKIGAAELRIVFNIISEAGGGYSATMDSPDQGAKGIQVGEVSLTKDSLVIDAPSLRGTYKGRFVSDTSLVGEWTQMGRPMELNLTRQRVVFKLNRPQEPHPPYEYNSVDGVVQNVVAGISLGCTVTSPKEAGRYPAVILVTGSGTQNRDEELMGHKPFKVIADHLTKNGIIVLRYDDRGMGMSAGAAAGATSLDLASDARAAFEYLKNYDNVDTSKIGVIGHSEGGLIALMLAAEYSDISFIISLAGPGVKGRIVIEDQVELISRISNVPEETMEQNRQINEKIFDIIEERADPETGVERIIEFVDSFYRSAGLNEQEIKGITDNIGTTINIHSYPWLRYFHMADPADLFTTVTCPVLALNGEKDVQVLARKNIDAIVTGLNNAGNSKVKGIVLPGLNHLFQHCNTGLVNEYGEIEETMSPDVLKIMTGWINNQ